jgi:hypothetical protein
MDDIQINNKNTYMSYAIKKIHFKGEKGLYPKEVI